MLEESLIGPSNMPKQVRPKLSTFGWSPDILKADISLAPNDNIWSLAFGNGMFDITQGFPLSVRV